MQVTSLLATTFFAFLALVAPLAIQARVITSPAGSTTIGDNNIGFSNEPSPSVGFFFLGNAKRAASPAPSGQISVTDSPVDNSGPGMAHHAGAIVGGVILGVVVMAALVFGVFFYKRRQQRQLAGATTSAPAFNLAGFRPHARSFSSTSASTTAGDGVKLEEDKAHWEVTLEEQFARARAQTPDIPRGMTPLPRNESPMPLRNPPRSFRT